MTVTLLSKMYKDTIAPDILGAIFDEAIKFTLPLTASSGELEPEVQWLIKGKHSLRCIEWVNAPMGGSVIYKARASSRQHGPWPTFGHSTRVSL